MDLQLMEAEPSAAERAAVDGLLGPPAPAQDARFVAGGHDVGDRRHLLLPALHAVSDEVGWISRGALNHICQRLAVPPADAYGVATFYAMFSVVPRAPRVAHVCDDIACGAAGGEAIAEALTGSLGDEGEGEEVTWVRSPCLGMCERAPAVMFQCARGQDSSVGPATSAGVLDTLRGAAPGGAAHTNGHGDGAAHTNGRGPTADSPSRDLAARAPGPRDLGAGATPTRDLGDGPAPDRDLTQDPAPDRDMAAEPPPRDLTDEAASVPQAADGRRDGLRLLSRIGAVDPESIDSYRAAGGYQTLRRAVSLGPERVVREVADASLTGRGGAAFPTGTKWQAVAAAPVRPHYLICNADESEPGTFKDRVLMESDPFALIEAMTIAGFATGCELGYLYIRGEYPLATRRLQAAIEAARSRGLLGDDILGEGVRFDVELRRGAGAYICGEETALMNSLEGLRGEPRNKPPFPTVSGLFGKPTVINNVETLVNVLEVLARGGPDFAATGAGRSTGTKLFCLCGTVARPGVYEVPMGTTLRELLELAGGVPADLRVILLGGAAGSFVTPEHLDVPLALEGTREIGASLGSGVIMAFDHAADMVEVLRRVAAFFRDESCGQCVPCRVGTVRQEEALARIARGREIGSTETEVALLDDLARVMQDASICGLGQTAPAVVRSAVELQLLGGQPR